MKLLTVELGGEAHRPIGAGSSTSRFSLGDSDQGLTQATAMGEAPSALTSLLHEP